MVFQGENQTALKVNDGMKVHGQGYISNLLNFIGMELFLVE